MTVAHTNTDPDADHRRTLAPLADRLARAGPDERRRLVARLLPHATPPVLRLLAELLIARLGGRSGRARAGAEDALLRLGPGVLPALERAVLAKPRGALAGRLAPLLVVLGCGLPERDRADLQKCLFLAACRAPTDDGRQVLWAATLCLHPTFDAGAAVPAR